MSKDIIALIISMAALCLTCLGVWIHHFTTVRRSGLIMVSLFLVSFGMMGTALGMMPDGREELREICRSPVRATADVKKLCKALRSADDRLVLRGL